MFSIVFQQVFIMFLLMLIGFVYAKATGMKKEECNRICNILLMVVTPCLLLSNLQRPFQKEILWELLFSLILAVASSFLAILSARFLFLPKAGGENRRIERYGASFGNVGFIGIPLVTGIFGAEYAVYAVVFVVVFHVLSWTVGVGILKGSFRAMSWKEAFLNPGVLSCLVAVPLFALVFFLLSLPFGGPLSVLAEYTAGDVGLRLFHRRRGLETLWRQGDFVHLSHPVGTDSVFDHAAVLGAGYTPFYRGRRCTGAGQPDCQRLSVGHCHQYDGCPLWAGWGIRLGYRGGDNGGLPSYSAADRHGRPAHFCVIHQEDKLILTENACCFFGFCIEKSKKMRAFFPI